MGDDAYPLVRRRLKLLDSPPALAELVESEPDSEYPKPAATSD